MVMGKTGQSFERFPRSGGDQRQSCSRFRLGTGYGGLLASGESLRARRFQIFRA